MNTIRVLLVVLLSIPLVSMAQEREFDETIYILQTKLIFESFEALEGCADASQFLTTEVFYTAQYELYALPTNSDSGKAMAGEVKVGEMGICLGRGEEVEEQSGPRTEIPTVFAVDIDELDYDIGGSGVLRRRAIGVPQPAMELWGWNATLYQTIDGLPVGEIGSMTANELLNFTTVEGYSDDLIVTLRLYTPRDLEQEAIDSFLNGLLGG